MRITVSTARAIALAAFAPILVFASVQIAANLDAQRRRVETEAQARAVRLIARADEKMREDLGALQALAASSWLGGGSPATAKRDAAFVVSSRRHWLALRLADLETARPVWTLGEDWRTLPANAGGVGDVVAGPPGCPCVSLTQTVEVRGAPRYRLILLRAADDLQTLAEETAEGEDVVAIVDRNADFIARSLDPSRIGRKATKYVQAAVRKGGSGIYRGVTFEGLHNRSAYAVSGFTGWSAHVAVPAGRLDFLGAGAAGLAGLGALMAFAIAAVLARFAVRDVQRREADAQREVQSQKLEAVGRFAGTVAHDFNNLLTVLLGHLSMLEGRASDPRDLRSLGAVRSAAERGERLTRQLLAFARDKPFDLETVDLAGLSEGMRDLLKQSLGPCVSLEIAIRPDARQVVSNATQLEAALVNLAVNARDAMPEGGTVRIEARPAADPGFVDVSFKDDGPGMDADVAARAIEPFFTTKSEGAGTGLGLAQVQSLALRSGGAMELKTAPGAGVEIVLRLPRARPSAMTSPSPP